MIYSYKIVSNSTNSVLLSFKKNPVIYTSMLSGSVVSLSALISGIGGNLVNGICLGSIGFSILYLTAVFKLIKDEKLAMKEKKDTPKFQNLYRTQYFLAKLNRALIELNSSFDQFFKKQTKELVTYGVKTNNKVGLENNYKK